MSRYLLTRLLAAVPTLLVLAAISGRNLPVIGGNALIAGLLLIGARKPTDNPIVRDPR